MPLRRKWILKSLLLVILTFVCGLEVGATTAARGLEGGETSPPGAAPVSLPDGVPAGTYETEAEALEPGDAVLFPFFVLAIGVFTYFFLSRFASWLPFTAVMFVIGTFIGAASSRLDTHNLLKTSITEYWADIDPQVLLLVFLPGLIGRDALVMDANLFQLAFWQCVAFAFPMVLAGTYLTALIGYYIFPYGWSFNFSLTFGAILSATDPVAVAALLEEVGAPPRLKIHIAGEALLNDGSAIVFFTIFSQMYLLELNKPGYGSEISVGQGFATFFRMSLGAVASGLVFGLGTLGIMWLLKRRLNREENVVETATTLIFAYLAYFTTEIVFHCSGIIGVLTYGLTINALGKNTINDRKLVDDFWTLVEFFLNTVLFTLGGLVWGSIISNGDPDPNRRFTGADWGYMVALYLLLTVIRYLLFLAFAPITYKIGLSTNWQEEVFQAFAGLRGAIGIALSIFIDNIVQQSGAVEQSIQTNRLFGMVGGVAFLTLIINSTVAGPLLRKLGLADKTNVRKRIHLVIVQRLRAKTLASMVNLLSQRRFFRVNFAVVRHHVNLVRDLTTDEVAAAVKKHQRTNRTRKVRQKSPSLMHMFHYLDKGEQEMENLFINRLLKNVTESEEEYGLTRPKEKTVRKSTTPPDPQLLLELRRMFLELVRASYRKQVDTGELADREYLVWALERSLDFAADQVSHEQPLNDWDYTMIARNPVSQAFFRFRHRKWVSSTVDYVKGPQVHNDLAYVDMRFSVERCMAFLEAHRHAQDLLREEFSEKDVSLSTAEGQVLLESEEECKKAEDLIASFPPDNVELIASHKFCNILLNRMVHDIEHLTAESLLSETEAEEMLDHIQQQLFALNGCEAHEHPGELPIEEKPNVDDAAFSTVFEGSEVLDESSALNLETELELTEQAMLMESGANGRKRHLPPPVEDT